MVEGRRRRRVQRIDTRGARQEWASLPEEAEVAVLRKGKVVARLAASPVALEELALGHLALRSELSSKGQVRRVTVRRWRDAYHVVVDARPARRRKARKSRTTSVSPAQVRDLMRALLEGAAMYREGGGVHTSALATPERIVHIAADIGKVNTLDRLAGKLLLAGGEPLPVLLTTGRVTGAMCDRALRLGCNVIISHSGPTTTAITRAMRARSTLIGYARGGSFRVYAGPRRVAR